MSEFFYSDFYNAKLSEVTVLTFLHYNLTCSVRVYFYNKRGIKFVVVINGNVWEYLDNSILPRSVSSIKSRGCWSVSNKVFNTLWAVHHQWAHLSFSYYHTHSNPIYHPRHPITSNWLLLWISWFTVVNISQQNCISPNRGSNSTYGSSFLVFNNKKKNKLMCTHKWHISE